MLAQGGEPTQPGGGGSPGGGGGVGGIEIQDVWLDREYVYIPSNAGGYVDEFIAQIDRFNTVWYILQDANFNVLGLTDSGGDLVEQRTYDPYGELLTRESFTAHPGFKAGHQGLFFDRLEPSPAVGGSVSIGAASQLEPSTFGIYQVRNRVLIPRYGRWAQKDPNASGMLHASLWHDGQSPSPDLATGSLEAMLGDGSNLFAFAGNSPFNATDPAGRFSFGNVFAAMSSQAALRGSAWGAGIGSLTGGVTAGLRGDNILIGMGIGAVSGAAGGWAGGAVLGGFAGPGAGGLWGLAGSGAIDGGMAGFLEAYLQTGGDLEAATNAGIVGAAVGGVTAGIGGRFIDGCGVQAKKLHSATRLDWTLPDKKFSDRFAHVRKHNANIPDRSSPHGVFDKDGVLVAEEAWLVAQQAGLQPDKSGVLVVNMGRRVGWEGGAGDGGSLSSVKIVVVPGTNRVITAYPVK